MVTQFADQDLNTTRVAQWRHREEETGGEGIEKRRRKDDTDGEEKRRGKRRKESEGEGQTVEGMGSWR